MKLDQISMNNLIKIFKAKGVEPPIPPPYGQPDRKISVFFYASPRPWGFFIFWIINWVSGNVPFGVLFTVSQSVPSQTVVLWFLKIIKKKHFHGLFVKTHSINHRIVSKIWLLLQSKCESINLILLTQTKAAVLSRCWPDRLEVVNVLSKTEEDGDGTQNEKLLDANHSSWSQLGTSAVA